MVLDGHIDATAIDSTVLELELRLRPELRQQIRIIETLGPSPIPPAIISSLVPKNVKQVMQDALLMMHKDADGERILAGLAIARFVEVIDRDYDPIRRMACKADQISFSLTPIVASLENRGTGTGSPLALSVNNHKN
jgi:phosphonate transport system substrate-binding protein